MMDRQSEVHTAHEEPKITYQGDKPLSIEDYTRGVNPVVKEILLRTDVLYPSQLKEGQAPALHKYFRSVQHLGIDIQQLVDEYGTENEQESYGLYANEVSRFLGTFEQMRENPSLEKKFEHHTLNEMSRFIRRAELEYQKIRQACEARKAAQAQERTQAEE